MRTRVLDLAHFCCEEATRSIAAATKCHAQHSSFLFPTLALLPTFKVLPA